MKIHKMGNKSGIYFPKDKQLYKKGELILLTTTKKSIPTLWATTDKAKELANTLKLWQYDLNKLKKEKGIQDSLILLNSLKTR